VAHLSGDDAGTGEMAGSSAVSLLKALEGVPSINPRERAEPAEEDLAKLVADSFNYNLEE
jgi:hypothetical protein